MSDQVVDLYQQGVQAEADETTQISVIDNEELQRMVDSPRWTSLAPSAKGCFILYSMYLDSVSRTTVAAVTNVD